MACGESACASVHRANRLGANFLLDLVVFGRACAITCKENMEKSKSSISNKTETPHKEFKKDAGEESLAKIDHLLNKKGSITTADLRLKLQKAMQKYAAVFRTEETLKKGFVDY